MTAAKDNSDQHNKKNKPLGMRNVVAMGFVSFFTVKPYFHYSFLNMGYEPFIASIIASSITIVGYVVVVDIMAYLTRLFKQ